MLCGSYTQSGIRNKPFPAVFDSNKAPPDWGAFFISNHMFIDLNKNFIFYRTKKTAGTSIEVYLESVLLPEQHQVLEDKRLLHLMTSEFIVGARGNHRQRFYDHMKFNELKLKLPANVRKKNFFKFCSVRNPFDKAVSRFWWESVYDTATARQLDLLNLDQLTFDEIKEKFKTFIQNPRWLQDDRTIYLDNGKLLMDDVIRVEYLLEDLERICLKLDIPFIPENLGKFKSTSRVRSEHYRDYYDDESIQLVANHCYTELKLFGYTF